MAADASGVATRITLPTRAQRQRVLMTGDTIGGVWRYTLEVSKR